MADIFEKNLRKFVARSNEDDFQTYSDFTQQPQPPPRVRQRTYFKNQRIYARRSSMSDLGENQQQQQQKTLQQSVTNHTSNSTVNVNKPLVTKHHHKPVEPPKQKPSTTELLKKARERNSTESAVKRAAVPRRTSTAY